MTRAEFEEIMACSDPEPIATRKLPPDNLACKSVQKRLAVQMSAETCTSDASHARAHVLPPVRFIVPGQPVPKGRAKFARRGNFVQTYTPEKTANYESLVRYTAATAMGTEKPFDGPVRVSLDITLAIPASWSKKRQTMALRGDIAATKKPDADNVLKAIKDGMNGIVYVDDAQAVELRVVKRYGDKPGVSVVVERIWREAA